MKVVIAQHRLLHYRVELFEQLRARCAVDGIDLHLVHGSATRRESAKGDSAHLAWADVVENRVLELGSRDLLWQPFPKALRDADLVILMQENRLISNYPWLFRWMGRRSRVAYWGHGRNFQSVSPQGLRERWKQRTLGLVDWWFGYTDITKDVLCECGFPRQRITVLNNAIDNRGFSKDLTAVTVTDIRALRLELGLPEGALIGLYCGSLYPDKRLDFLVEAADRIRLEFPDFHLLVIGDGPSRAFIGTAAGSRPWILPLGVQVGKRKAACFRLADVVLNPGLVGLHVLDAFCAGLPMVTTEDALHSPEISYLEDGVNGLIAPGEVQVYAATVCEFLRDERAREKICEGARASAATYTLDNMVTNFMEGISACLSAERLRERQ